MAQPACVEDVGKNDEYDAWRDSVDDSDDDDNRFESYLPPEAPTPPAAVDPHGNVNVFDFLVNGTPTASQLSLLREAAAPVRLSEDTQLVRYDPEANAILEPLGECTDQDIEYATDPKSARHLKTPMPKSRRVKNVESAVKKAKKRKRLHIETDHVMTDAPPVMHSGLTGGLNRMMGRPHAFPPSPDLSTGDAAETPASPLKKTKHNKYPKGGRPESIGNSLMAMLAVGTRSKSAAKKRSKPATSAPSKKSRHRIETPKDQMLLEYRLGSKHSKNRKQAECGADNQMVLYKPCVEQFLRLVEKGPDSRGCSLRKALRRWHRDCNADGKKVMDEKELFKTLRLRKNDRGEIVLFCG